MKKNFSKILSVLLVITVILGVTAIGASAVESDTLSETEFYVAGTLLSEGYYLVADGGITAENATAENYNVKFTPATASANATLTLNNAKELSKTIDFDGINAVVISGGSLDVELIGENTITGGSCAFAAKGNINFMGNGSISSASYNYDEFFIFVISAKNITVCDAAQINLDTPEPYVIHGFLTEDGTVTIKENASVNMKITGTGVYSAGLTVSDNARLTVDSAEISHLAAEIYGDIEISDNAIVNLSTTRKIFGYDVGDVDNYALKAKNGSLTICDNAQLNATAGDGEQSIAVYSDNSITVRDEAELNAKSGNVSRATLGIFIDYSNEDAVLFILDNAQVTAKSGNISGGDDCYPYNNGFASGGIEANNIYIRGNSSLTGIGGSATDLDEGSVQNDCGGIYVADRLVIDGAATVKGIGGTAEDTSCGIFAKGVFMEPGCNAKLEGVSEKSLGLSIGIYCSVLKADGGEIIVTANTSVSSASCGIYTGGIYTTNTDIKATASSGNNSSIGIYAEEITALSEDTVINAKSADAKVISSGLVSKSFTAEGNVNINTAGGDAEYAYGLAVEEATVTGDAVIDARAGNGIARSAGIYTYNSSIVSENAKITAIAGKADELSVGIYGNNNNMELSGNALIVAKADTAKQSFGFAVRSLTVSNSAYVEILGENQAVYAEETINLNSYTEPYVAVSTDTKAENAVDWDGTTALSGEKSIYKYVLIAPEKPAEPEPELSFFEKLIADIIAFFNSIIEFFASLFSF